MPHRLLRGLAAAALILLGTIAPAGAALASEHPSGGHTAVSVVDAPGAPVDTNAFTFDSFDSQYELGIDAEGRSTLTTTETLVAVFPDFDQNRGIKRSIPSTYDGHPLHNDVISVTDENGTRRDYDTSYESDDSGSFQVLTIAVPEGSFVHGAQTYVITYSQRDVTKFFANTNDDEFYWDVNGTGWAQPFGAVSATVTLGDGLAGKLTSTSCYYGSNGSTQQCEAPISGDGVITASVSDLGPYQNMSIVAAFPAHTFTEAPFDLFAWIPPITFAGLAASIGGAVLALVFRFTAMRGARGTGIVIAQYEPDDTIGPLLAANLLDKSKKGMAASIVDLAVRGKIRIVERPDDGFFATGTTFGVQQINDAELSADDQRVMNALFATVSVGMLARLLRGGGATAPGIITLGQQIAAEVGENSTSSTGEVRWLTKKDAILGQQVVAITKSVAAEAITRKLRKRPPGLPLLIVGLLVGLGFVLLLFGGISAQTDVGITLGVFGTIAASWLGVGALVMLGGRRPLTPEGALAVEHLHGLREYIRLAEADRLQMLQSVTGAERVPSDKTAAGSPAVITIYEKLLPYAVIFGLEKQWAGELAKYYDETPPDWYQGGNITAFNVGAFAAGIGSLSSSVSSSYSGSASSSSSGGSGGGGSSGGGGGGGGGGGV